MKIALVTNLSKDKALECTKKVIGKFLSLGIEVKVSASMAEYLGEFERIGYSDNFLELIKGSDVVCVVGGDGTIIHAAKYAAAMSKPILGINLGKVGFLANVELSDMGRLELLAAGNYDIESRMMLDIEAKTIHGRTRKFLSLNDAVILRAYPSKMIHLDVFKDDLFVNNYSCDGLIVSTPTGSTAYSLSSGGPVIEPSCECMLLTPICPHTLASRSIVLDNKSIITVKPIMRDDKESIFLNIDGNIAAKPGELSEVSVRKSEDMASFIKLKDTSFFNTLNKKLTERRG